MGACQVSNTKLKEKIMNCIDVSMNEKRLVIALQGEITSTAVQALVRELDCGFDYYQYPAITVELNSPGGEYIAMRTLLDTFKSRRQANFEIYVHASHLCASAAALVLAHGPWGTRSIEPHTHLQFHWARATLQVGQVLTSDMAASLARGLSTVDKRTLECLVAGMSEGAGSSRALVDSMASRLGELLANWDGVAAALHRDAGQVPAMKLVWVKELQSHLKRWSAETNPVKRLAAIVSCLNTRFEKDSAMDLREAYALCLVDRVAGVLPVKNPVLLPKASAEKPKSKVVRSGPVQAVKAPQEIPSVECVNEQCGKDDTQVELTTYAERAEA
jgi:ATP-dependent protease ClpP protease subunit